MPDSISEWVIALQAFEGQRVTLEIEQERSLRSLRANAYYWSVLVPLASHLLSKTRDLPLSKDQTHYALVAAFAGCDETPFGPVPVPTRTMNTAQFSTYCERVTVWLTENGYPVPTKEQAVEVDEERRLRSIAGRSLRGTTS